MSDAAVTGTPFSAASKDEVDVWSRKVFEELSRWPIAALGKWTRWEPGYLVLEITSQGADVIEPIVIDTAEDELTITFGYWETHLPTDYDAEAKQAADEAKGLVRQWLAGEIRTAIFTDASGKWCGSILVEGDDILPQLSTDWIASFNPTQVELRTPNRSNWRRFSIGEQGVTEVCS